MSWRDRVATWCLRVLVPNGISADNQPIMLEFSSGRSTPDDPKLVMTFRHLFTGQVYLAVVLDPDMAVRDVNRAVEGLRDWAAGGAP